MHLHRRVFSFLTFLSLLFVAASSSKGGALEDYIEKSDTSYSWKLTDKQEQEGFTVARIDLTSQTWRDIVWKHKLVVVRPKTVRNPDMALLFVTGNGNGDRQLPVLKLLAERAGATAAVITSVPNQPLFDGKNEDALIAYTFAQYLKTSDPTWPLLFPMTKSAVRAMDAIQEFTEKEFNKRAGRFLVTGASKRGWTTYLTGAVDKRVVSIAPMVFDILNMKVQTDWQKQVYGKASEQINDYKEANILSRMSDPAMVKLREWVDPYNYRSRYTMPKLILLGSNDPYWTVDSLRYYWNDLPGPKLLFQTPNAGHDLNGGKEAMQTLAAFFQMIADRQPLPKLDWTVDYKSNQAVTIDAKLDQPFQSVTLWTATSTNRDFRDDHWLSKKMDLKKGDSEIKTSVDSPAQGFRAFLVETELTTSTGQTYKLSTPARVTPDTELKLETTEKK